MLLRELACSLLVLGLVRFIGVSDFCNERVVGIWVGQQTSDGEQNFRYGECWAPIVLEYV